MRGVTIGMTSHSGLAWSFLCASFARRVIHMQMTLKVSENCNEFKLPKNVFVQGTHKRSECERDTKRERKSLIDAWIQAVKENLGQGEKIDMAKNAGACFN